MRVRRRLGLAEARYDRGGEIAGDARAGRRVIRRVRGGGSLPPVQRSGYRSSRSPSISTRRQQRRGIGTETGKTVVYLWSGPTIERQFVPSDAPARLQRLPAGNLRTLGGYVGLLPPSDEGELDQGLSLDLGCKGG